VLVDTGDAKLAMRHAGVRFYGPAAGVVNRRRTDLRAASAEHARRHPRMPPACRAGGHLCIARGAIAGSVGLGAVGPEAQDRSSGASIETKRR
jgi:hypothetical protein